MKAPAYSRSVEVVRADGVTVRRVRVELSRAEKREVEGYARRAGMALDAFVDAAWGEDLGIDADYGGDIRELLTGDKVRFECTDPALLKRIQAAAGHYHRTLQQYVAEAVSCSVEGEEEDMILHPHTGEVIASRNRLRTMIVSDEWIGPKGRSDTAAHALLTEAGFSSGG